MPDPNRLKDVTPAWLGACLRQSGAARDAEVTRFEAEPIGLGRGFAGRLYRVRLHYDRAVPGAPATLIAKFAADHAGTREMLDELGFYGKEVRFYREVAERVPLPTPRCYLASYDPEAHGFVLLLEDLAPAAAADLAAGLSLPQAKDVLAQLARTHARFWDRTDGLEWLAPGAELMRSFRRRYQGSLTAFEAHFGARFPYLVRVARQCGWILEGEEFMRNLHKSPQTLTHADLHLANLFFPTAEGGRFAVVDWQNVMLSRHGASDVARIVGLGLRPESRRAHEDALLRHYHAALLAEGVRGYGLRMLRLRYREELAAQVLVAVVVFETLDFDVEGGEQMTQMFIERLCFALEDAHVAALLAGMIALLWPIRPLYRAWLALTRRTPARPPR